MKTEKSEKSKFERLHHLNNWLDESYNNSIKLTLLNSDASFRKYYRFSFSNCSYIAVDSPPDHEKNQEFITVQNILAANKVNVPQIIKSNLIDGFFVLQDFGDQILLPDLLACQNSQQDPWEIYKQCLVQLIKIQLCNKSQVKALLPNFDDKLLTTELELFRGWFVEKYLNLVLSENEHQLLNRIFTDLIHNANEQPVVLVHRDFHSRNLMALKSLDNIGVIDFQDAVWGPLTYDLISLFRDSYIAWPLEKVKSWTQKYFTQITSIGLINKNITFDQYWQWFLKMSLQRNLKVIGIFARLFIRDGKAGYLGDIPRTLNYAIEVSQILARSPEYDKSYNIPGTSEDFSELYKLFTNKIKPLLLSTDIKNTDQALLHD
ncbi:MAG: phosphotransferase [Gammaproteobacteria bacterium]|nr:phosphotransferase [Gammaproteobacteria bacterium]